MMYAYASNTNKILRKGIERHRNLNRITDEYLSNTAIGLGENLFRYYNIVQCQFVTQFT
jgi:hypothetical protein